MMEPLDQYHMFSQHYMMLRVYMALEIRSFSHDMDISTL